MDIGWILNDGCDDIELHGMLMAFRMWFYLFVKPITF